MLERVVRSLPAIAWMAFIFAMSSQEQFPRPIGLSTLLMSIAAHMFLFGVLALLLLLAIARDNRPTRSTLQAIVIAATLYGVSDEFHQSFVPSRDASVFDLAVNAFGASLALVFWTHGRSFLKVVASR